MSNYGALATIPRDVILARIRNGEMPVRIAEQLGVGKSAISERFRNDPEYRQALELSMEVRLDMGELALEAAGDDLNLARVREIAQRRREWRAEREFPHRWGQRQQLEVNISGDLGDRLRRAEERTIVASPQDYAKLPQVIDSTADSEE